MKVKKYKFFTSMIINLLVFVVLTFITMAIVSVGVLAYYSIANQDKVIEPYKDNMEGIHNLEFESLNIEEQLGDDAFYYVFDTDGDIYYQSKSAIDYPLSFLETMRIPNNIEQTQIKVEKYQHPRHGQVTMINYEYGSNRPNKMLMVNNDGEILFSTADEKGTLTTLEVELAGGYYDPYVVMRNSFTVNETPYMIVFFDKREADSIFIYELLRVLAYVVIIDILILTAFVILYLIRLHSKVIKPIKLLSEAIKDFELKEHKIDYSGPREFMDICDKFNEMTLRLSKAEADKKRILAGLSHDIRTPLTVLQTYTQALNAELVPREDEKKYLKIIHSKAKDMSSMVQMLNDYSYLFHNEFKLNLGEVNLSEMIRQYFIENLAEIENQGFDVILDIEGNINAEIDLKQFKRVLSNLVSNTIKYNESGVNIYVRLKADEHKIHLYVGDDGVGIDENIIDQVFEAFVIDDQARTTGKGTGLGLSIVEKIIELHQGSIALIDSSLAVEFEIILTKIKKS